MPGVPDAEIFVVLASILDLVRSTVPIPVTVSVASPT